MRMFVLLILFLLSGAFIYSEAQNPYPWSGEPVFLCKQYLRTVYNCPTDTLGFRKLTAKTSLKEYKFMEDKTVYRTLKRIKKEMIKDNIYDKIGGKKIKGMSGGLDRVDERHVLCSPSYRVTDTGVILIGKYMIFSPSNDIYTGNMRLQCYWIGFDKQVEVIRDCYVPLGGDPFSGTATVLPASLVYFYSTLQHGDILTLRCPPLFIGEEGDLKHFLEARIHYTEKELDEEMQGLERVTFTVETDGSITGIEIVRGIASGFGTSVKKAVEETSGMWKPGRVEGEAVPVRIILDVRFLLDW